MDSAQASVNDFSPQYLLRNVTSTTGDEINPLRGIYVDLLGCLGETKPEGQARKPMTGFSQILNLITDVLGDQTLLLGAPEEQASIGRIHEIFQNGDESGIPSVQESLEGITNELSDSRILEAKVDNKLDETKSNRAATAPAPQTYIVNHCTIEKLSPDPLSEKAQGDGQINALLATTLSELIKPVSVVSSDLPVETPNAEPLTSPLAPTSYCSIKKTTSTSNDSKEDVGPPPFTKFFGKQKANEDEWMDKSPFNIGGSMITSLLESFVGLGCPRGEGGKSFNFLANALAAIPSSTRSQIKKSNVDSSSETCLKSASATSSIYHDCCVGALSDDNCPWESAESEID